MKKRSSIFVLSTLLSLTLILTSCNKSESDDSCRADVQAAVSNVIGSTTGTVGQTIPLAVYFGATNGCGRFGAFQQSSNANTTLISVIASYEGCVCTQNAPTLQATYNFTANLPGTYDLKFLAGVNYLTHTIVIQ